MVRSVLVNFNSIGFYRLERIPFSKHNCKHEVNIIYDIACSINFDLKTIRTIRDRVKFKIFLNPTNNIIVMKSESVSRPIVIILRNE